MGLITCVGVLVGMVVHMRGCLLGRGYMWSRYCVSRCDVVRFEMRPSVGP